MKLDEPKKRLRDAIVAGNLLIVKRLLKRFPKLLTNIDSSNGWSSLHYASYYGRYLVCVYLIQLGHDKHEMIKTFKGNTCVHLALLNGHEQTTHLLLQHFPQFINEKGEFARTPVHIACMNDYFRCLSLLIGVGADLSIKDSKGETPLHICMEYGSTECLKLLLQDNNNENIFDDSLNNYNWKPIDVAQTFEFGKLFNKLLKERKAEIAKGGNNINNKRPSFQVFRTPLLENKSAFEDGPSPVLSLNPSININVNTTNANSNNNSKGSSLSNNSTNINAINFINMNNNNLTNNNSPLMNASNLLNNSYNIGSPLSKLPTISNSRKTSFSTIANSNFMTSRKSSESNRQNSITSKDFFNDSNAPINDNNNDQNIRNSPRLSLSHNTLSSKNDNNNINNYLSGLKTPTSSNTQNNTTNTNIHCSDQVSKNPVQLDDNSLLSDDKSNITSPQKPSITKTNATSMTGKRVSLLNIPITRIRNGSISTINSQDDDTGNTTTNIDNDTGNHSTNNDSTTLKTMSTINSNSDHFSIS